MVADIPDRLLEIDEEGFLKLGPLRVQDAALEKEVIENISLAIENEPRSPLLSTCGGKAVVLDPFDCPLVAQQVEDVDEVKSTWSFIGGVKKTVPHSSLQEDIWGRIHSFVGEMQLPAVLSRKAQASFLNALPIEDLSLAQYWENAIDVNTAKRWQQAYDDQLDRWEMGRESPPLSHYGVPSFVARTQPILVPGAGRGHDADWIAQQGFETVALDLLPHAKSEFEKAYPDSRVDYRCGDVFEHLLGNSGAYAGIFEHTIFCAINPSRRVEYLEGVKNALADQGIYFGVFFRQAWQGGPPFGMTQWELRELCKKDFELLVWEPTMASAPQRLHRELWAVLKKK